MEETGCDSIPDGHFDKTNERITDVIRKLYALKQHMHDLDRSIERIGYSLNISQPPMDGKIGIRWWRIHGGSQKEPVFVEWKINKTSGRFFPKRISERLGQKVKSRGGFAHCLEQTKSLVAIGERQIEMRKSCFHFLQRIELSLGKLDLYQTATLKNQKNAVGNIVKELGQILSELNSLE